MRSALGHLETGLEHAPSSGRLTSRSSIASWSLLVPVAWGVVLFGAVYPWAYIPLLAGVAAIGVYGWSTAPSRHREPARGVLVALCAVLAVIVAQLIPLPIEWLAFISPHTDAAVQQYDVGATAARAAGAHVWHPMSIAPGETLKGLVFFVALAASFAGTTAMLPRIRLKWLVRRLTALGLAIAMFGIVQRGTFNGRLYWVWSPINAAGAGNAFGPFVNRNHFAGWMLMIASLAAGYLCSLVSQRARGPRRRSWRERMASLASSNANRVLFTSCALIVMALSIVWTMSRSGIGAFAAGTSMLMALAAAKFRGSRRTTMVGLLLAVVVFALSWKGIDEVADWYGRTSTLEWRIQLWRDTAAIVRDFPWFGTGLDTYGVSTLLYPTTDRAWHAMEAHNDYVQIVSEGGVALAAAAAFVVWFLIRAIRTAFAQPQTDSLYWVRAGATIGLVAIAIQELTDFSLQMPGNAVLFALLAAIAIHHAPRHERPTGSDKLTLAKPRVPSHRV